MFPPSRSFTSLLNKGLSLGDTVLAHRSGFPRSLGELPPNSASSQGHEAPSRLNSPTTPANDSPPHAVYPAFLGYPQLGARCLGFFGFLGAGELTVNSTFDPSIHLTVQDLQVDAEVNPSSLRVSIKSSKADPLRQECFIYLGRGQAPLCPISAILAYLHLRGLSSGPLFIDTHGRPLTRSRLSSFIQSVLQGAGIPGQFSGHSFRIGAATTAVQSGIPDHLIKTMGRWTSDAYQLYVRAPVESILEVSGRLLQ